MSITSSGAVCDVCGKYIMGFRGEMVEHFTMTGIQGSLCCCSDTCGPAIKKACAEKDWKQLPDGPIRQLFAEQAATQPTKTEVGDE